MTLPPVPRRLLKGTAAEGAVQPLLAARDAYAAAYAAAHAQPVRPARRTTAEDYRGLALPPVRLTV
jgi:hypothetical protein